MAIVPSDQTRIQYGRRKSYFGICVILATIVIAALIASVCWAVIFKDLKVDQAKAEACARAQDVTSCISEIH